MRYVAVNVTVAVFACSSTFAQVTDMLRRKSVVPGNMDFLGRSATKFSSIGWAEFTSGSIQIHVGPSTWELESGPFSNPQGATIGDAVYTGSGLLGGGGFHFTFVPTVTGPSPATRLQYSYDFTPPAEVGPDGFLRLPFASGQWASSRAGLLEVEVLIAGHWQLGQAWTGGLSRTISMNELPWNIIEDFVFHPTTNTTRFYATRLSTGTGIPEGMLVSGFLVGAQVPSCYPNCDQSTVAPVLSANDFVCFMNRYTSNDLYANCDLSSGSPLLSANDFVCFLNAFAGGCS